MARMRAGSGARDAGRAAARAARGRGGGSCPLGFAHAGADLRCGSTSGALRIEVTPLAAWVLEAAAPDTRERLLRIAEAHGPGNGSARGHLAAACSSWCRCRAATQGTRIPPGRPAHAVAGTPESGRLAIRPLTPGWGRGRLSVQASEIAVYAYGSDLDLKRDLTVAYQGVEDSSWARKGGGDRGRAREDRERGLTGGQTVGGFLPAGRGAVHGRGVSAGGREPGRAEHHDRAADRGRTAGGRGRLAAGATPRAGTPHRARARGAAPRHAGSGDPEDGASATKAGSRRSKWRRSWRSRPRRPRSS